MVLLVGMCAGGVANKKSGRTTTTDSFASAQSVISSAAESAASGEGRAKTAGTPIVLDVKEQAVLRAVVGEDLDVFSAGGESSFRDSGELAQIVVTTADNLQKEYEKNEVAGDKQFRNKTILLRGKIASVDRSIGNNYFISLRGGTNMFMQPKAKMEDGHVDYMAGLEKNQSIKLVCQGDGMLVGSAIASSCKPYSLWRDSALNELIASLIARLQSRERNAVVLVSMAIAVAPKLSGKSACVADGASEACINEVSKLVAAVPKSTPQSRAEIKKVVAARLHMSASELDALLAKR